MDSGNMPMLSLLPREEVLLNQHSMEVPLGGSERSPMGETNRIYRFIMGIDQSVSPLTSDDVTKWLCDSFAELILKRNKFPLTLKEVLKEFEATKGSPEGVKNLEVHHIAEGGQIPWSDQTAKLNRTFRLALSLPTKGGDTFISTGIDVNSETLFLQIMSWDPKNLGFNFYQRKKGLWVWAGNSKHALEPGSRGKGPFSGHVNGGPVMKELKQPWVHWRSMNSPIDGNILPPEHPFLNDPLFKDASLVRGGENFEAIVRSAFSNWNAARIEQATAHGKVENVHYFLRQIIETTNLNLTSSLTESGAVRKATVVGLPITFFYNLGMLSKVGVATRPPKIEVSGELYLASLKKFDFALVSKEFKLPGDTHFAFVVPEPAVEDGDLLEQMISAEMISPRLAACLLMIDFCNPIFSKKRAQLMQYVPATIAVGSSGKDLDEKFIAALVASKKHETQGTPENEFFACWSIPIDQWKTTFTKRILDYITAMQTALKTTEGFDAVVKLAEFRRRQFMELPLFEFSLTFPTTNIAVDQFPLEMTEKGTVIKSTA